MIYELGISSVDAVTIKPEYNFTIGKKQIKSQNRARSGKLYLYKWSEYKKFKFGLNFVSDTTASIINSWWDTNTELLFFMTSGSNTEVHSVMILNNNTPLGSHPKPHIDKFKGSVQLEGY